MTAQGTRNPQVKTWHRLFAIAFVLGGLGLAYWKFAIPTHRVVVGSELVMLGDLNGDYQWTAADLAVLDQMVQDPFAALDSTVWHVDVNRNGAIDGEDLGIIRALVAADGNPYDAEEDALDSGQMFPRPRELYRYMSLTEYRPRPLWLLTCPIAGDSVLEWLPDFQVPSGRYTYADSLSAAVYAEAVRFDLAWRKRQPHLRPIEREYAAGKLARAGRLFEEGERYELLLALMELVEDAETLTVENQPEISLQFLAFRDHLREVLGSPQYDGFASGTRGWRTILQMVSRHLEDDLGLTCDLTTLEPPRNVTDLKNYLQRAEWQYYKSMTREQDFRAIIGYAQHDLRYLRAVSRTSRKHQDRDVRNHNLPMVLLFREALRIVDGDKKRAVGLLDEAIRIPYSWIKLIPPETLPGSLALDNFLLPGNKEDGADKSRHWNVFGGICIYKSPEEALDLALKREVQDLRDAGYSEEAMREFLRDMIANLNGMYHVLSVNPDLLAATP
jgi:hypothetical protein